MQEIPLPFLKYYIQKNGWFLILFLICEVRNVNDLFRVYLKTLNVTGSEEFLR